MEAATARLLLRRPRLADVPELFRFLGDAEAMRHTRFDPSLRACRRRIAVHERRRRQDGFAPWTVLEREGGRILGWGGLYIDPSDPGWGPEIGYFFHPEAQGRGYATELASAALAAAWALGLPALRAFAHPANAASRRVLEKSGFLLERYVPEMDRLLYQRPCEPPLDGRSRNLRFLAGEPEGAAPPRLEC